MVKNLYSKRSHYLCACVQIELIHNNKLNFVTFNAQKIV